jgi:hypothetical protein
MQGNSARRKNQLDAAADDGFSSPAIITSFRQVRDPPVTVNHRLRCIMHNSVLMTDPRKNKHSVEKRSGRSKKNPDEKTPSGRLGKKARPRNSLGTSGALD